MFNAPLLGNGRFRGNRIMSHMWGTWWDATTQASSQSVHWLASYGIANIFQHGGRPTFWILKFLILDHVIVIVDLICCSVSDFIKIGSRVWPTDAHNCRMFNAPLLGNGRRHGNQIVGTCREHDGMWPPKLGLSRSIDGPVMTFLIFSNMAAVRHFEF